MTNKKGAIELTLGFLIFIILGIIVFVGMLSLAGKFFAKTGEIQANLDAQTDAQIENLLETGEKVIIPVTRKVGRKGDVVVFGLGIRNELGRGELFGVRIKCKVVDSAACDNDWIQMFDGVEKNFASFGPPDNWIIIRKDVGGTNHDGIDININDKVKIPIGIKVNGDSGTTYVFDVEVWNDGEDPSNDDPFEVDDSMYSSPLKLYVEIP